MGGPISAARYLEPNILGAWVRYSWETEQLLAVALAYGKASVQEDEEGMELARRGVEWWSRRLVLVGVDKTRYGPGQIDERTR